MKKALLVFLVFSLLAMGCDSTLRESDFSSFQNDLSSVLGSISNVNDKSDKVYNIVYEVWDNNGPDYVINDLALMYSLEDADSLAETSSSRLFSGRIEEILGINMMDTIYDYETPMDWGKRTGAFDRVFEYCQVYKTQYDELYGAKITLESQVKNFKKDYESNQQIITELVSDLYVKTCSYADLVLNPTGSLITYTSDINDIKSEIKELKSKIELEK